MFEWIRNLPTPSWQTPAVFGRVEAALAPYIELGRQKLAPHWARGKSWYDKREPREKVLLQILGGFLGLVLLYNLIYLPVTNLRADLANRVASRKQMLIDVRGMMRTYDRLQADLEQTQKRTVPGRDFSLFSVLEQTLTKSVGRDKIGSITPSDHSVPGGLTQYTVDVKLSEISLAQVV